MMKQDDFMRGLLDRLGDWHVDAAHSDHRVCGDPMTEHLPECPLATACKHDYYNEPPIQCANCGESCICDRLRACEERMEESMDRAWAKAVVEIEAHARSLALDAAQKSILALHKPAPVIECECGWGYNCPECGSESNRIIGYACSQCCNSWPHTAYCDDMHNEDGTPLHHPAGAMWSGPHCPVIALIDALREKP